MSEELKDLREDIKEIYSAYVPVIEIEKIKMAFEIGLICWNFFQDAREEDGDMPANEITEACMDETGLSKNQVQNTVLFVDWLLNIGMIVDGEILIDSFYSWWEHKQGTQLTLARIYRLILPKPEKKVRNAKIDGIKKAVSKYLSESNYASIELSKDGKMVYEIKEGI